MLPDRTPTTAPIADGPASRDDSAVAHGWPHHRLSVLIVLFALAVSVGVFSLSRNVTSHDEHRLVALQAQDAKTALTSEITQIQSTMASVGSVAAAAAGDPAAVNRLAAADPALGVFSALAVLHRTPGGGLSVVAQRGTPSAPLPGLTGAPARQLAAVVSSGGLDLVGFFGTGSGRRLALAVGAPVVPNGYIVYAEVPLPAGAVVPSGFPHLQLAMYGGPSPADPVLFASTARLPLSGERVSQLIDLNNPSETHPPGPAARTVLFVVSFSGPAVGRLAQLLPWILAALGLVVGLLVAATVEGTRRRRDLAYALVADLEASNAELDRAFAEQAEAQQTQARLEGELRQSQRLEAVGRLAGGVAHDFNNLLAVILAYTDFIGDELGDHPLQSDVSEVRTAARRAVELTRQLLTFSRRDLVKPEVLDVNAAITGLLNILRRTLGEDVDLCTDLSPDLPLVLADPGELEQVVVNLAVNARDAITGHGTITVETSEQDLDDDAARAHALARAGRYVRVAVTDTGCGMTPDVAAQVFEPFFTTKAPGEGTGLGLSTVYAIANRYGGYVTLYSEPGLGTTIKVYLPASDQEATAPPTRRAGSPDTGNGETVLVVEDQDAVRKATRRILERVGYRVLEASDGADALSQLDGQHIDLLLTDVVMPGGVSGRELADELRRGRPGLRVLYMSGYSADIITTRGILDEGVIVVEKPFSSDELLAKVRELLVLP